MGWDGRVGILEVQKNILFANIWKTTQYFFLIVFGPLRRGWMTFSVKNSEKNEIFIFVKKFRTIFFSAIFPIFWEKNRVFLKFRKNYSINFGIFEKVGKVENFPIYRKKFLNLKYSNSSNFEENFCDFFDFFRSPRRSVVRSRVATKFLSLPTPKIPPLG